MENQNKLPTISVAIISLVQTKNNSIMDWIYSRTRWMDNDFNTTSRFLTRSRVAITLPHTPNKLNYSHWWIKIWNTKYWQLDNISRGWQANCNRTQSKLRTNREYILLQNRSLCLLNCTSIHPSLRKILQNTIRQHIHYTIWQSSLYQQTKKINGRSLPIQESIQEQWARSINNNSSTSPDIIHV